MIDYGNRYKKLIEELNVSEQIKDFLRKVKMVASSGNTKIKESVTDMFIKSPSCSELSRIAKVYESIITGYSVYPMRGIGTYLELAFPYSGYDSDYKEFFASPRRVAVTQNFFSGCFLISFEQWRNAKELINDERFSLLIDFIESNKENISFVFHVTPDFRDEKDLFDELNIHTNLFYLEHYLPDRVQALEYIKKQIREANIELNQEGMAEIDRIIDEKVDFTSKSYCGYETLDKLSRRILFELYTGQVSDLPMNDDRWPEISGEDIAEVSARIDIQPDRDSQTRKIGFV
ncbi:MAG: hypothetical protein K6A74_09275 [Lachnospiraceae bacterium]|nr:hypothetical protein [Lachnospiraceae bacterium]